MLEIRRTTGQNIESRAVETHKFKNKTKTYFDNLVGLYWNLSYKIIMFKSTLFFNADCLVFNIFGIGILGVSTKTS